MPLLHPPCSQWASGWGCWYGQCWCASGKQSSSGLPNTGFILEREEPLRAWEGTLSWVKGLWVLGIEQTQRHQLQGLPSRC